MQYALYPLYIYVYIYRVEIKNTDFIFLCDYTHPVYCLRRLASSPLDLPRGCLFPFTLVLGQYASAMHVFVLVGGVV